MLVNGDFEGGLSFIFAAYIYSLLLFVVLSGAATP